MTDTTPKRISRAGALRAAAAGGEAQRAGKPIAECPYDPSSSDVVQRFYARHWTAGWVAAQTA